MKSNQVMTTDAPFDIPELGTWVTRCGPRGKATKSGMLVLYFLMAVGVLGIGVSIFTRPQPGSELAPAIFFCIGIGFMVVPIICILVMRMMRYPQIDMYTGGLRYKDKKVEELLPWSRIRSAMIITILESRFTSHFRVVMVLEFKRELTFDSKVEGNPEIIIEAIAANVQVIETRQISLG